MLITLLLSISSVFAQSNLEALYDNTLFRAHLTPISIGTKTKSITVTHSRVSMGDVDTRQEKSSCYTTFSFPIEKIEIEMGSHTYSALATAYANIETSDDGSCTSPKLDSTLTLPLHVSIEIQNEKPAISFLDSKNRTINIFNYNTLYDQGTITLSNEESGFYKIKAAQPEKQTSTFNYIQEDQTYFLFYLREFSLSGAAYDPELVESFDLNFSDL